MMASNEFTCQEALDTIGLGRWHMCLLCYSGLVWASDATEIMLLSYIGPAVGRKVGGYMYACMHAPSSVLPPNCTIRGCGVY